MSWFIFQQIHGYNSALRSQNSTGTTDCGTLDSQRRFDRELGTAAVALGSRHRRSHRGSFHRGHLNNPSWLPSRPSQTAAPPEQAENCHQIHFPSLTLQRVAEGTVLEGLTAILSPSINKHTIKLNGPLICQANCHFSPSRFPPLFTGA